MAKLDARKLPRAVKSLIASGRRPKSWSLSRYGVWKSCALRYALKHIAKLPDPPSSAMERGIAIHLKGESFLKGKIKGVPSEFKSFAKEMRELRRLKASAEADWTITEDGTVTKYNDWNNAWCRAKVDAHVYFPKEKALLLIDFKTGRVKEYETQRSMYAWLSPYFYPDVEKVEVELWFTDHGDVDDGKYERRDFDDMDKKWRSRAKRMLEDKTFAASPGDACKWCPYRSDKVMANGEKGPCEGWKLAG